MIIYERFFSPVTPKTSYEGFLVIIVCIPIPEKGQSNAPQVGLIARLSVSKQVLLNYAPTFLFY